MCEISIQVCCPHCEGTNVKKNGRKANGKQNFLCQACRKQFQAEYTYRGANPKIKQLALKMAVCGSGIRDTGNVLDLFPSSVLRMLRNHSRKIKEPDYQGYYEGVELDEFWSFVRHRKTCKRWCWYAYDPQTRKVLAFHIGRRNRSACRSLYKKLTGLDIDCFFTDDYKAYAKVLPPEKHYVGKEYTTHIERRNRDFRTHLKRLTRRTVCHSKSDEMHYLFIKMYINRRNVA